MDSTAVAVAAFCAVYGAGIGLLLGTAMLVAQANTERDHLGVASSTIALSRTIGGSLGLAVAGTAFYNEVRRALVDLGAAAAAVNGAAGLDAGSLPSLSAAQQAAYQHAAASGSQLVFSLLTVASLILLLMSWFIEEVPLDRGGPPMAEGIAAG